MSTVSATDTVYAELRRDLRLGMVNPWDRVTEKTVATHFGVSRTPVRESLARLVAEGLLQKYSDGFGLVLPEPAVLGGLYEARMAIELQGIRRVSIGAGAYDEALLQKLEEEWESIRDFPPEPHPKLVATDENFHRTLLLAAGEPALVQVLGHINDRIRALRMYGYVSRDRLQQATQDHLSILRRVSTRDYAGASAVLEEHITSSRKAALERSRFRSSSTGFTR